MSVFDSEKSCKACVHQGNLMTSDGIFWAPTSTTVEYKTKQTSTDSFFSCFESAVGCTAAVQKRSNRPTV